MSFVEEKGSGYELEGKGVKTLFQTEDKRDKSISNNNPHIDISNNAMTQYQSIVISQDDQSYDNMPLSMKDVCSPESVNVTEKIKYGNIDMISENSEKFDPDEKEELKAVSKMLEKPDLSLKRQKLVK